MEPPQTQVTVFVIYVRVDHVELHPDGWYVHFDGSWESINLGPDKPFDEGDRVKITFEKVTHAKPQPASVK